MLQKLTAQHDVYLAVKDAKFLVDKPSSLLSGALKTILLWPIKKLVRKVVYVLAVKSCADVATAVFHEGWLFARALEQGYVEPAALGRGDKEVLENLREAIFDTVEEIDPDATRQAMQSAFAVGREVTDSIGTAVKSVLGDDEDGLDDKVDAAEEEVGPLTDRILDELSEHWSLGESLDAEFRRRLGRFDNACHLFLALLLVNRGFCCGFRRGLLRSIIVLRHAITRLRGFLLLLFGRLGF